MASLGNKPSVCAQRVMTPKNVHGGEAQHESPGSTIKNPLTSITAKLSCCHNRLDGIKHALQTSNRVVATHYMCATLNAMLTLRAMCSTAPVLG